MSQQKPVKLPFLGLITGFVALLIPGILFSYAIRNLIPTSAGSGSTNIPTSVETQGSTSEYWSETAEAVMMQTRNALIAITTITPPPTCCLPTDSSEPFLTGIFKAHVNPQPFANLWQGLVNGQQVRVYAGGIAGTHSDSPNLTKGVLKVQVFSSDLSNYESVMYETSELTGWIEVIAEEYHVLTLEGQNGQTLYFNVLTMQFVPGLTATVTAPTITPLPTIIPTTNPPTPYPIPEENTPSPVVYPPPETSTPLP